MMNRHGLIAGATGTGKTNAKIKERCKLLKEKYTAKAFPVELLTLSGKNGVKLRATVSEFGPELFAKMLELNEAQSSVVALLFQYCDDHELPLLDLKDFKKILTYAQKTGKEEFAEPYGSISTLA